MKQILQSLADGSTEVIDAPAPRPSRGHLAIASEASLVSAGTERMLVEFGRGSLLAKARSQPDKVRQIIEKARTDGIAATYDAVRSKLDQPIPLGYCNVGRVIEVGRGVEGFAVGDRVVSNGPHAEIVVVPQNLCAKVPEGVTVDQAVFTVLGAIGLQGIRLAEPTLGECVVVTGLGLIGLLTVQMLRAQGCRVLGIDTNPARLALARSFGAEVVAAQDDVLSVAAGFSRGRGVDAVLITASTKSNDPVSQAARMCRKRGRIVLVGVTGLNLSRADFYEKELRFQVSCSYGPGRYDAAYEEGGIDYPIGFVRWTQQRNFEAVIDLMAAGAIHTAPLLSHRFGIDQAQEAYDRLAADGEALGIVLDYDTPATEVPARTVRLAVTARPGKGRIAVLGAGNFASRTLIPALLAGGAIPVELVSAGGANAAFHGRKHGFERAGSDSEAAIARDDIDVVIVATRHDSHARLTTAALNAGHHVFCEKPLCLTVGELAQIGTAYDAAAETMVMVGFNRRFAPHTLTMRALLAGVAEPKAFVMTVNAGAIPAGHWTQDTETGGGRIIGEACHFIDLLRHLADAPITELQAMRMGAQPALEVADDKVTITLRFADGSIGTVHYLANGHRAVAKERLEVFAAGRVLQLDNWVSLIGHGWPKFSRQKLRRQDKGTDACAAAFIAAVQAGGPSPIAWEETREVAARSIEAAELMR